MAMLNNNAQVKDKMLNEFELAKELNINVKTIRRWRLFNRGPRFLKVGGKLARYPASAVKEWLDSQPSGGSV